MDKKSPTPETFEDNKPKLINKSIWIYEKRNPPFAFSQNHFVYVESSYNETMNNYIRQHIDQIRKEVERYDFKFVYIPEIANLSKEELATVFPTCDEALIDKAYDKLRNITTAQFTKAFLSTVGTKTDQCLCGFVRFVSKLKENMPQHLIDIGVINGMAFEYFDFKSFDEKSIEPAMDAMYTRFSDVAIEYNCLPADYDEEKEKFHLSHADSVFNEEQQKMEMIAKEIRTRIEVLKQGGYMELLMHTIGEDLIRQLSNSQHRSSELPRIKITNKLKIVMPELDNREVKMPTLARAMYIFFLRHEEGLEFKKLSYYEDEIFNIYRLASNRTDEAKLHATVEKLVDAAENKVNECASRIKEAFIKIMDDYQAKNYYITQKYTTYKRNNPWSSDEAEYCQLLTKKVTLPRTLVEYPQCLLDLPKDIPFDYAEHVLIDKDYKHRVDVMNKLMKGYKQDGNSRGPQELYDAVQAVLDLDRFNYLALYHMGHLCCNKIEYKTSIKENTIILKHDDHLWNTAYINRAEAYLYAKEYDKGLADIRSYFNTVRRYAEADKEAMRIRKLLEEGKNN